VRPHWKRWAELAGTILGGLDILTVDAMHRNGEELIIEINDTASGLASENKAVDMQHIVDVCVNRMNAHWGAKANKAARAKVLNQLGKAQIGLIVKK
jgi:glutathione synthase/RimK-type ligase-like ATP-grasp enzyme